jgi:hypothetical protein
LIASRPTSAIISTSATRAVGAVDGRFREASDFFVLTRMICEPKKRSAQYVYARLEERSLIWVKPRAARRHYEFAVTTIFKVE